MRCSKLERGAQRVMELINFHSLSASEAARLIREGVISSERLMEACLTRIREVDERVQAWAFLDPDHAVAWMMRKEPTRLEDGARCLHEENVQRNFLHMVNKYFKDSKGSRSDQKLRADKGGRLSPDDELVKKHSRGQELDWRLMTAQMYQESRFDPKANLNPTKYFAC